ncbi:Glu/Leu/Phe/Val family dehydrogenase [Donghicola tyrosinivorans]|uniref:Leucine dehydrogenase n=1 Tax=Donghicola tyrosinivorans TaxID=1652492 RepID=A0A2T0X0L6_9RHOB|nr:Glu/Leu/Phe/Val dehydrogenase [Donghicola tyrosinivorans]PRY92492.1 leucine dehydrogenase [Donghicola tyrosinivorans]
MLTKLDQSGYEGVYRVEDAASGLRGYIAVHSTVRGPAAGGLRMRPYAAEAEALEDVLRLSAGMTYKNAAADLPLGGGKAVIIGDPAKDKSEALLRAMGRAVEALEGKYWTAEDMGMSPDDMAVLAQETKYVAGLGQGDFASGDPSPVTAAGVLGCMEVAARHAFGSSNLQGKTVAVQGLGHVGMYLAEGLHRAGAKLIVADTNARAVQEAMERFEAVAVAPEAIHGVEADIYAPCAIGGTVNMGTIPEIKAKLICGAANNQLASRRERMLLEARDILYAPDYVANGGGIINVAAEILKIETRAPWVAARLGRLEETMDQILNRALRNRQTPADVADALVEERLTVKAA